MERCGTLFSLLNNVKGVIIMDRKKVFCKKCGKEQFITMNDVKREPLPIDIPFTSSNRYFYYCKYCKHENGLFPDELP